MPPRAHPRLLETANAENAVPVIHQMSDAAHLPPVRQLGGLSEVLLQSLLLAVILCFWVDNPGQRWLSWLLGTLFVVVMLLSSTGFIMARAAALGA